MQSELKFGTSGLRGPVVELNGPPAWAYTTAFLKVLADLGELRAGDAVCVGRDLRASSPAIAGIVRGAIRAAGYAAVDCGLCPTPALSLYASGRKAPAIMVTGSHIPDDRNGLKFYKAGGEIDKADEQRIVEAHAGLAGMQPAEAAETSETVEPLAAYIRRYCDFFRPDELSGLRIGVYQHSSVIREVVVEILTALGAAVTPLGWSDVFVPVDTEAVSPEDLAKLKAWAAAGRFDAIVSSDGDGDRPLVADEHGNVVRGDAIGAITARLLGADAIVTPLTSNSALEHILPDAQVFRTKVGSPFVIAGLEEALAAGRKVVVGFEANGGLILGSSVKRGDHVLQALPTRDAVLPILACLGETARRKQPLSRIVGDLGLRAGFSNRLEQVPQARSAQFLQSLSEEGPERAEIAEKIGPVAQVDQRDGVKLLARSGEVLYFRASGNAPELRCYVEALDPEGARALLEWGLDFARARVVPK